MSLDQIVGITPEESSLLDYALMTENSAYYLNPEAPKMNRAKGSHSTQPFKEIVGVNSYALVGGNNK